MSYVLARDSQATVMIFPSDSFFHPEEEFLQYVTRACRLLENFPDRLILLGADADRAETEYGWIEQGPSINAPLSGESAEGLITVKNFYEKPQKPKADGLLRHRCLWNTMVIVVKVGALWDIGKRILPELMNRFDLVRKVFHAIQREPMYRDHMGIALSHIYRGILPIDFSRDVLAHAVSRSLVLPMTDLAWSDWGRPERIANSLTQIGARPAFQFSRAASA